MPQIVRDIFENYVKFFRSGDGHLEKIAEKVTSKITSCDIE